MFFSWIFSTSARYFTFDNNHAVSKMCCTFTVDCPVGTHANSTNVCHECPMTTYQDEEGQTDCKFCPGNMTSDTGAVTETQCK